MKKKFKIIEITVMSARGKGGGEVDALSAKKYKCEKMA